MDNQTSSPVGMESGMSGGKKVGMIVGALVMLIAGGVIGYILGNGGSGPVAQQTTTPTATPTMTASPTISSSPVASDWKTYEGTYFNLSYLSTWQVKKTTTGSRTTIDFSDQSDAYPLVLSISSAYNQGGITLNDWLNELQNQSGWKKTGQMTIDGQAFYVLTLPETDAGLRYIGIVKTNMIDITTRLQSNTDPGKTIFASIKFK